jgi:hypothetical protein
MKSKLQAIYREEKLTSWEGPETDQKATISDSDPNFVELRIKGLDPDTALTFEDRCIHATILVDKKGLAELFEVISLAMVHQAQREKELSR